MYLLEDESSEEEYQIIPKNTFKWKKSMKRGIDHFINMIKLNQVSKKEFIYLIHKENNPYDLIEVEYKLIKQL